MHIHRPSLFNFLTLTFRTFPHKNHIVKSLKKSAASASFPVITIQFHCFTEQRTMASEARKEFVLKNTQPVVSLDCQTAFNLLTNEQKLYAHHLARAGWNGGLIVLVQTSPESPLIFTLLRKIFAAQTIDELKKSACADALIDADTFMAFLVYACGIFTNMGNYKGTGDSKIVPNMQPEQFAAIVRASEAFVREPKIVQSLLERVLTPAFRLDDRDKTLGLSEKGITKYFSLNCSSADAEAVNRYAKYRNFECYICRAFKTVANNVTSYEIRLASAETGDMDGITSAEEEFEGCKFRITRGDYAPLLALCVQDLELAKKYTTNENEINMLNKYIESFTTGSLAAHKDGSRYWIKNKGPIIETYIGFIETYRDPAGTRGEFEAFVAMVNKEMSEKFNNLVSRAETLLPMLPWPSAFEKDKFLQPDFTSLDVLSFAGSSIPAGINIPNYDEIRQSEGFKNVSLGNVIPASYKASYLPFLSDADQDVLQKYRVKSFELQVGLHELLGHGSGKLFRRDENGTHNFDAQVLNPLTNEKIDKWYEPGDSYDGKFTTLSSSYEECRAECVGLALSLEDEVLKVFGIDDAEKDDVVYVNWLSLLYNGAGVALEMYQPTTKTWLQAHAQARYVIMRVILEAGEGLLTVTEAKGELQIKLDRSKLHTIGKKAIRDFLLKLQVFKTTGDIASARELYDGYSNVPDSGAHPWAKWRDIIIANKQERKMFVQSNTFLKDGEVILKHYEPSVETLIQSFVERFTDPTIDVILEQLYEDDLKHFSL